MNRFDRKESAPRVSGLGLALLLLCGACVRTGSQARPAPKVTAAEPSAVEDAIRKWPEGARATARAMIGEYGAPDRAAKRALRWSRSGPWAKIIVHRSAWPHVLGDRDKDYLEQTVDYRVPRSRLEELQRFDDRLEINESGRQMSARSPNEPMNILILNLAHDIGSGRRDVRSARDFCARTEALSKAGKASAYMERLLFLPPAK